MLSLSKDIQYTCTDGDYWGETDCHFKSGVSAPYASSFREKERARYTTFIPLSMPITSV